MSIFFMSMKASLLICIIFIFRFFFRDKLMKSTFILLWYIVIAKLLIPYEFSSVISIVPFRDELKCASDLKQIQMMDFFTSVWLIGVVALLLYYLILHIYCVRKYEKCSLFECRYIDEWKKGFVKREKIKIVQSNFIDSPLTYGLFEPIIVLPKRLKEVDFKTLSYVLNHEYVHIKHFDVLMKYMLVLCVCIHWFNPFIWLMYKIAERDIEIWCDETVLNMYQGDERAEYAMTLLSFVKKKERNYFTVNSLYNTRIEERVLQIMKYKRKGKLRIILSLVLVCFIFFVFGTENVRASKYNDINSVYGKCEYIQESIMKKLENNSFSVEIPRVVMKRDNINGTFWAYAYDKNNVQFYTEEGIVVDYNNLDKVMKYIYNKILN